jgi:hypothetical protein
MRERPTQDRIKELFHYDPETGIFTRRLKRGGRWDGKYGRQGAGRVSELGYVLLMIDGVNYIAGQVAWAYVHGAWPCARIKYIDGDKLNNRIDNIRVHDKSQDEIKAQEMTAERLRELLHYEPLTGRFTWRVHNSVAIPGERAGGAHGGGYRSIGIDYKKYLEHTLAVLYVTGQWPENDVDHKNGIRSDNRWENLIVATKSENNHNKGLSPRNKTGYAGICKHGNKYRARLEVQGKPIDLGCFSALEDAIEARKAAIEKYGIRTRDDI